MSYEIFGAEKRIRFCGWLKSMAKKKGVKYETLRADNTYSKTWTASWESCEKFIIDHLEKFGHQDAIKTLIQKRSYHSRAGKQFIESRSLGGR